MTNFRKFLSFVGLSSLVYAVAVRPRMLRWGATDEEVRRPYPGQELIPDGTRSATMAVTIEAPPDRVWPWLAQMGTDRGGWYSWDRLDNWGRRSVDEIHQEWQTVNQGDRFTSMPDGSQWWEVAAVEPGRFLALRASIDLRGRPFDPRGPRPRYFTDSTWCFLLEPLPGGRTRLIESGYWAFEPRWLQPVIGALLIEPEHWIMQTRQFANLKRRAERSTGPAVPTESAVSTPTPDDVVIAERMNGTMSTE